jgi:transposase
MASFRHAAFQIGFNRGKPALQALLGGKPRGIYGSDRWWAYTLIPVSLRQLCWAHLKRDLRQIAEREGEGAWVGRRGLRYYRQVFELWHRHREGRIDRAELRRRMHSLERRFGRLLRKGLLCPEGKTAKFCANVLRFEESLWTFVRREGVEPTNNLAERILRSLVLWRKISFGCHSEKGFRFVERVLTVTQTLKLQGKAVFQFLCDAVTALRNGKTAPSLA